MPDVRLDTATPMPSSSSACDAANRDPAERLPEELLRPRRAAGAQRPLTVRLEMVANDVGGRALHIRLRLPDQRPLRGVLRLNAEQAVLRGREVRLPGAVGSISISTSPSGRFR